MGKKSTNRTFSATIDNLHTMLKFIRAHSEESGLNEDLIAKVELALEEALVNIIKHGFVDSVPGTIKVNCHILPQKGIQIIIMDDGIPYNPLLNPPKKDLTKIMESELSGGYGIYLITRIMDEVFYEHKNGLNCLSLIKLSKQ
jgi:serine/threonine-protein kinase RsbW